MFFDLMILIINIQKSQNISPVINEILFDSNNISSIACSSILDEIKIFKDFEDFCYPNSINFFYYFYFFYFFNKIIYAFFIYFINNNK